MLLILSICMVFHIYWLKNVQQCNNTKLILERKKRGEIQGHNNAIYWNEYDCKCHRIQYKFITFMLAMGWYQQSLSICWKEIYSGNIFSFLYLIVMSFLSGYIVCWNDSGNEFKVFLSIEYFHWLGLLELLLREKNKNSFWGEFLTLFRNEILKLKNFLHKIWKRNPVDVDVR